MDNNSILVVGAGIAGIEVSLVLANAGKTVHIVERNAYIGGNVIKFEDVFANMECATCMIAPKQQELLRNENIILHTLSEVVRVNGTCGNFTVKIREKARYVNPDACIGCDACFEVCSVSLENEFEEGLGMRKAIYTPCPGALPNVPRIDAENCLRFNGKDCEECKGACMFEAIEYDQQDKEIEITAEVIVLATGFMPLDPGKIPGYGYGLDNVYTAFEFERMYASNGPTEGKVVLKNGKPPGSAAVIFNLDNTPYQCPASICTMYSLKFIHYLRHKIPDITITEFYREFHIPGKSCGEFFKKMQEQGPVFIRTQDLRITGKNGKKEIVYNTGTGQEQKINADMVIVATPMRPREDAECTAQLFDISLAGDGFFAKAKGELSPVMSKQEGIFIIGCAGGAKNIGQAVTEAQAAGGRILSISPIRIMK